MHEPYEKLTIGLRCALADPITVYGRRTTGHSGTVSWGYADARCRGKSTLRSNHRCNYRDCDRRRETDLFDRFAATRHCKTAEAVFGKQIFVIKLFHS